MAGSTAKFGYIMAVLLFVAGLGGVPMILSLVWSTPAAAVTGIAPGPCGSVLLAGSAWLGGHGVDVKSNGPDQGKGTSCGGTNSVDGIKTGSEWQCVELVNRLYVTRGWISATWPGNGGRSLPGARNSMYDKAPSSLSKQANGSISYVGPGDVVSINVYYNGAFQADGHVLIVNASGKITSGSVPLVSQNGGSPSDAVVTSSATLSGGKMTIAQSGLWSYSVIGVVHAPTAQSDTLWGINTSGQAMRYAGNAQWTYQGGPTFKDIAADSDGSTVAAVSTTGAVYTYTGNGTWHMVSGATLTDVADLAGTLWGINTSGQAMRYAGNAQWTYQGGPTFKDIAASGSTVAAVSTTGAVYTYTGNGTWHMVSGATLTDVTVQ